MTAPRRLIGETSLRARAHIHTRRRDGCIIRKGMVGSWMMARIEGWPPGGSREWRREDRQRPDAPWMPYG